MERRASPPGHHNIGRAEDAVVPPEVQGPGVKGRLTPNLFSTRRFRPPYLPAARGIFVATLFICRLGDDGHDRHAISGSIYSDKGQISGTDVTALFGMIILHPDLHAHFHRSVVDAIDRGTQDYKISDTNGHEKIQMINGSRHHVLARVAMGGHGSCEVDPVHEASAKKSVQWIGVVRQHD